MSLGLPTQAAPDRHIRAALSWVQSSTETHLRVTPYRTQYSQLPIPVEPGQPGEEPQQPQNWLQVSSQYLSPTGHRAVPHRGKPAAMTSTLIMKVGLSTINFLSPDLSPEGYKSWRRPQAGTCAVATYSWAEWCRHLCHHPRWQSSWRGRAGATAPSLGPAVLTSAMLAQGRVYWEIKGITHISPVRRIQLQQAGEVGSAGG